MRVCLCVCVRRPSRRRHSVNGRLRCHDSTAPPLTEPDAGRNAFRIAPEDKRSALTTAAAVRMDDVMSNALAVLLVFSMVQVICCSAAEMASKPDDYGVHGRRTKRQLPPLEEGNQVIDNIFQVLIRIRLINPNVFAFEKRRKTYERDDVSFERLVVRNNY